jgi:hypothetical protein
MEEACRWYARPVINRGGESCGKTRKGRIRRHATRASSAPYRGSYEPDEYQTPEQGRGLNMARYAGPTAAWE